MKRPRPPRRVSDVRGPRGKACLDEGSILKARALIVAHGLGRTIAILRTSDTTLEKALAGLPMTDRHARRLQAQIAKAAG